MSGDRHGRDIPVLTSLRGFAAWWVVLYHVRILVRPYAGDATMAFLAKGYLAVDMFFVLSGFVIYLNYADRLMPTGASYADFLVRRIARVYPLHLLMLLAAAAYAGLAYLRHGVMLDGYRLDDFVLNFFLMQNWGLTDRLSWNVPSWSISTELAAYLLFPIIPLALRIRGWPSAAIVATVVALLTALHLAFALQGGTRLGWNIQSMGLVRCLAQFACGALLCEMYLRLRLGSALRTPLCALLFAAAALLLVGILGLGWPETLALPALWTTLILGLALWPDRLANPLRWRPLVYIGEISYGTYLCHYLAFILFKQLFVDQGQPTTPSLILLFILGIALASAALYHAFERPAQRVVMQRWRASGAAIAR